MFPDRIFDINVMRLGFVSIVIQMWATFMEKLWVFMRSLGNVSVHSILETFPLCSLLREIFVILFFVNSGAVFGLASVTFLRCCPIEVCELRASAFDVSAHDSRLFLSRDWGPGYGSWLGSDGKPWVGSLYSVPWLDTSLLVSLFALKDSKWVALIFWEKTKQNENRRVALGARMLTLDLTSFYFKFMLVIDFAKAVKVSLLERTFNVNDRHVGCSLSLSLSKTTPVSFSTQKQVSIYGNSKWRGLMVPTFSVDRDTQEYFSTFTVTFLMQRACFTLFT